MEFSNDTNFKIFLGICILVVSLAFLLSTSRRSEVEGYQNAFQIPKDAENESLTNSQIFGVIPAAASASLYRKYAARKQVENFDALPFDKESGTYMMETQVVDLNPDPNDIEAILTTEMKGVAVGTALALAVAYDKAQAAVQKRATALLPTQKVTDPIGAVAVKSIRGVKEKISAKIQQKIGNKAMKKVLEKAVNKIATLIARRAAAATAAGAVQNAIPDPTGITKVFGTILTVLGVVGLAAQVAITTELKGDEGFCPSGYERLNGAIPSFMSKVPGVGDILDVMGAYVCYRNSCESNEDEDAGLCYDKCDRGYKGVGPVCWANSNNVGTGQLKECPAGWTNDGLTCRDPIRCDPVYWDGCCSKTWPGICWGCLRGGSCRGGTVKGRAAGSDLPCPRAYPNQVDGLCYANCPSDTPNRVAGMPYLCSAAASVGDGRGKTSYGRGVGRPKLKMKPVQKSPTPPPAPPGPSFSNSFADDPNTNCKTDFSSTGMLEQMCKFYYKSASAVPETVQGGIKVTYISRVTQVVASGEQSCDVMCELTTITLANATSKTPTASTTVKDKTRRFYFAKLQPCLFVVTAATNVDNTGKEISNADTAPVSVNYSFNPFV